MRFETGGLPRIQWKDAKFFLVLYFFLLFQAVATRSANAIGWAVIVSFVLLLLYAARKDPFQFLGFTDRTIFRVRFLLFAALLVGFLQLWRILIEYVMFEEAVSSYDFAERLLIFWRKGLPAQGLGEELVFRSWVLHRASLRSWRAFWSINIAQSLVFAAVHLMAEGPAITIFIFTFGFAIISGLAIRQLRSVLPSGSAHALGVFCY